MSTYETKMVKAIDLKLGDRVRNGPGYTPIVAMQLTDCNIYRTDKYKVIVSLTLNTTGSVGRDDQTYAGSTMMPLDKDDEVEIWTNFSA